MANLYKQINQLDFLIDSKEAEIELLWKADITSYRHAKDELIDLLLVQRDIFSKILKGLSNE
jgi:hypothetical protein